MTEFGLYAIVRFTYILVLLIIVIVKGHERKYWDELIFLSFWINRNILKDPSSFISGSDKGCTDNSFDKPEYKPSFNEFQGNF